MIELDSLKFTVDTSEVASAVTKVKELQSAITALNVPLKQTAKASADAAKGEAALAVATEKVNQEKAKTAKLEANATAAKDKAAVITAKLNKETKEQTSVLERQQNILEFMRQGYSSMDAAVLSTAKAHGALADELKQIGELRKSQRDLIGGNPFDKSVGGLINLQRSLKEVNYEQRLVGEGVELTSKQYKELARDQLRLTETAIGAGKSFEEMAVMLDNNKRQFIETATALNHLTAQEKERERAQREVANAQRAVLREDERIESMLRSLNIAEEQHVSVTERATRSIANYERNLRLAGVTGEQASKKLAQYRSVILQAHEAEQKMKTDRLSRALAPQISDVVVSLAGGMNPMTVLLQQGLQVRDLIGMSGVAVQDLQKSFKNAASDMVGSIKGTAVALGSLLVGGLVDAGISVKNFAMQITGLDSAFNGWRNKMLAMNGLMGETPKLVRALDTALVGLGVATTIGFFAAITAAFMLAKGLYDVIKQENELARAMAISGASLGFNHSQMINLIGSMEELGVSGSDAMKVFTLIAKEGVFAGSEIKNVTKAAVDMQTYGGVAIEETVKKFAKLKEKPVEALIELGKQTGLVSVETIKYVSELQKQGRQADATAVAIKAMADVNKTQVDRMKNDYNDLTLWMIETGKAISNSLDAMFNSLFRNISPTQALQRKIVELKATIAGDRGYVTDSRKAFFQTQLDAAEKELAILTTEDQKRASALARQSNEVKEMAETTAFISQYTSKEVTKAKELEELERRRNKMTKEQYEMVKKQINEKYKVTTPGATPAENYGLSSLEKVNDLINKYNGSLNEVNAAEQLRLDIMQSDKWAGVPEKQKELIKGLLDQHSATLDLAKSMKELDDARMGANKIALEWNTSLRESNIELFKSNNALEDEIAILGLSSEEQRNLQRVKDEKIIQDKKLLLITYQSIEGEEEKVRLLQEEIGLLEKRLKLGDDKQNKERFTELRDSITDAIVTGLFEGGKAGSKKLRDIIEAELRKPVTIFVQAIVSTLMGNNPSTGATGGLGNIIANGKKAWDMVSGIGSSFGDSVAFGADALGEWLVNNTSGMLNNFGSTLMEGANTFGSAATSLGNIMAGYNIQKMLSNGYKVGNGKLVDIATLVGSYFFGPIAGVVGGVFNRLFGRKLKDTGIEGTFGGDKGFSGSTYQFYKGGWFRSDKTKYSALDEGTRSTFANAYQMMTEQMYGMASILKINTDALDKFSYSVKFSTNGMNQEQIQKKITEVFTAVGEAQAKRLLGTFKTTTSKTLFGITKTTTTWTPGEFVKDQETALEAIQRLSSSIVAVNTVLNNLNATMLEFSLTGADMASSLVDLFGGIDSFQSAMGTYYDQYYTQEEKLGKLKEYLVGQFEALNIALPKSIEEYKALVKAQDLTSESGRETFAALIKLSPAFSELSSAVTELISSIVDEVKRLRGEILGSSTTSLVGAQSQFAIATAAARAGDSSAIASLPELSKAVEEAVKLQAASASDIVRIQAWLVSSLTETSAVLGTEVPAFASGGLHAGGVRIVGENGPELEVTGPSRIYNAAQTANILSGSSDNSTLVEEVQMLRAEVRANVVHSAKIARILERVTPDGDSIATTTVTP